MRGEFEASAEEAFLQRARHAKGEGKNSGKREDPYGTSPRKSAIPSRL